MAYRNDALVARIAKDGALDPEEAAGIFEDAKRFLYLCSITTAPIAPAPLVDDEWNGKENISVFSFDEIISFLKDKSLSFYFRSTEEGYGLTMSGKIKYWHIHQFIVKRED